MLFLSYTNICIFLLIENKPGDFGVKCEAYFNIFDFKKQGDPEIM